MRKTYKLLISMLLIAFIFCLSFASGDLVADAYGGANSVYLGGTPIGVVAASDKLIVIDTRVVITKEGAKKSEGIDKLLPGDLLISLNGKAISTVEDIGTIINGCKDESFKLVVSREGNEMQFEVTPLIDILENNRKLGIIVKNEIAGIGTLTYVRLDNKRFGGLGHQIFDEYSKGKDYYNKGKLYCADIMGVVKGEAGKAGELRGSFKRGGSLSGKLDKNSFSGVFGVAEDILYDKRPLVALGSRSLVQQGNAYIYTTLDGETPQKFEIEIVKAVKQPSANDKSMVIHVTDKELLEKAGGICQGMSGSPIVQNGRLVGAVTHVFINDPTRGYGIYIDWMVSN
ncbi:MAG: SpoIVB peptidase S55 domain-containing protein [Clostridia bacterium]|nr:SpoIVB peptidase S55 domain-containing protein [Clostridia bacterium]